MTPGSKPNYGFRALVEALGKHYDASHRGEVGRAQAALLEAEAAFERAVGEAAEELKREEAYMRALDRR